MPEFLIEIGSEEIPASYIEPAVEFLQTRLAEFFKKNHIATGQSRKMATPRRLFVAFAEVASCQEDRVETFLGPNVKVAYDKEGKPTKAAIGFARGKGVDVADLTRETTAKGEVVCARVEKEGQPTASVLVSWLPELIRDIPFPKKMRWGDRKLSFARPLHWIAALFDGKPLDFKVEDIQNRNQSFGHRFLKPGPFEFADQAGYLEQCEKHFVIVDPDARKKRIQEQVQALAAEAGGKAIDASELMDEVNYLVEYPVALKCGFEKKYLELPKELLVMTMRHHQRYFPVEDAQGNLLPHFITITNLKAKDDSEIRRGNERVLRARLEDARFFFEEDRKRKLEDYVERLRGVIFQKALGTSYEKMERFRTLAGVLAEKVCPESKTQVDRAAWLCKADLETQMVYEFPELQGVMGSYYAEYSGEDPEVALAIKEHYRPAFAGDASAQNAVGAVVAIADKLDTILGCISVGLLPTGSEDPYGLRRNALGIIQTVLDRGWQVSLDELIARGIELLQEKTKLQPQEIRAHTLDLFRQRFKSLFSAEGFPYDVVDAVLSTGIDSVVDVKAKVAALSDLKQQPHFEPLAIAFRRVVSILTDEAEGEVRDDLLQDPAEKDLHSSYLKIQSPVEALVQKKDYAAALQKIVEIKPAVDTFFDKVMVMVEDAALRKNRMRLLRKVSGLFSQLADFSRIVLEKS